LVGEKKKIQESRSFAGEEKRGLRKRSKTPTTRSWEIPRVTINNRVRHEGRKNLKVKVPVGSSLHTKEFSRAQPEGDIGCSTERGGPSPRFPEEIDTGNDSGG